MQEIIFDIKWCQLDFDGWPYVYATRLFRISYFEARRNQIQRHQSWCGINCYKGLWCCWTPVKVSWNVSIRPTVGLDLFRRRVRFIRKINREVNRLFLWYSFIQTFEKVKDKELTKGKFQMYSVEISTENWEKLLLKLRFDKERHPDMFLV